MAAFRKRFAREAMRMARRLAGPLACLLWLSTTCSMASGAQHQAWQTASDEDGIRIETRRIPGERFDELRIGTSVDVAPAAIADYLFGKYLDEKNRNIRRSFVRRGRALTIWSDVIDTPMISKRCYSMRFERRTHAGGEVRVKFDSLDFIGSKPMPDCIALRSRGEWVMTPSNTGTRLVYVSLTDIGGKVPAAFARRSLTAAALLSLRKVVAGSSGLPLPRGIGD